MKRFQVVLLVVLVIILGIGYGVWHHYRAKRSNSSNKVVNQSVKIEHKVEAF